MPSGKTPRRAEHQVGRTEMPSSRPMVPTDGGSGENEAPRESASLMTSTSSAIARNLSVDSGGISMGSHPGFSGSSRSPRAGPCRDTVGRRSTERSGAGARLRRSRRARRPRMLERHPAPTIAEEEVDSLIAIPASGVPHASPAIGAARGDAHGETPESSRTCCATSLAMRYPISLRS